MQESKKNDFDLTSRIWTVILSTIFAVLLIPTLINVSSYVETKYFPVVSELNIEKWERTPDNATLITGNYKRNRECTFEHLNWYLKGSNSDIAIPVQRVPRDTDLPPGRYSFGPWKIFASPEELEDSAYAIVYHSCHPFYDTESIIYAKGQFR